jgi:outer membrane protein OmpA-like peptidoglycan-associated protein
MNKFISIAIPFALLGACTPVVPPELADARRAYQTASQGPAAQVAPADLHKARESLDVAERSFEDAPKSQKTKDLSYVAERKSEMADALGKTELSRQARLGAERDFTATQGQLLGQARGDLQKTRTALDSEHQQLTSEQLARMTAEQRAAAAEQQAKDAQDALAKLAMVKQEERGMVITLSGSVLFASDKAELLPDAQTKLDQVAQALMATKSRKIIVEGFTDSRGTDSHNVDLSKRRAEAVRAYIVSRGYDSDLISSEGMGKAQPVADNASAEGRANNRRVEIVVKNKGD